MIQYLFPTPVYMVNNKSYVKMFNDLFDKNADKLHKSPNGFLTSLESYNPKKANCHFDVALTECGEKLSKYIIDCTQSFMQERRMKSVRVEVANMWINQMDGDNKQFHEQHTHYGYVYSGVYYVNCPLNSSGITFLNDTKQTFYFHQDPEDFTPENSHHWTFPTENGDLVIFPSNLKHEVKASEFEGTRRSVAFDLNIFY